MCSLYLEPSFQATTHGSMGIGIRTTYVAYEVHYSYRQDVHQNLLGQQPTNMGSVSVGPNWGDPLHIPLFRMHRDGSGGVPETLLLEHTIAQPGPTGSFRSTVNVNRLPR